jgi:hypothetical protein
MDKIRDSEFGQYRVNLVVRFPRGERLKTMNEESMNPNAGRSDEDSGPITRCYGFDAHA